MQAIDEAKAARSQAEATKADNLELLERLKYVQGYQAQTRTRKSGPLHPRLLILRIHLLQVSPCGLLLPNISIQLNRAVKD